MRRTTLQASRLLAATIALHLALPAYAQAPAGAPASPPPAPPGVTPPSAMPPSATPPDAAPPASPPAAADGADEGTAAPDPQKRADAEAAFRRGLSLLAEDAWQAALAEFLRSRDLYPTRNATNNAAFCLRKLNRFDESLDVYEALLREYPDMDAEKKAAAQKEVAELRGLVGTIDIASAEPGASIVVDGRARPDFPLLDPLRVAAGTHTVRLFKEGFRPYETRVDVAGGQTVRVTAKMAALAASGRLRIAEKSGAAMDVVISGAVVGVTPWEGSLPVGDQVVWLQGDGDLGTQPVRVPVKQSDTTVLTLAAEPLEAGVSVQVQPPGATIRIDSVEVGRGVFEGRLRRGRHTVELLADGFFPQSRTLQLERGDTQEVAVSLQRDEDADAWRKPSRITFDATGGLALSPSLGGDVAASCGDGCSSGVALGALVMVNAAYELGSGVSFGLSGGFLHLAQTVTDHDSKLAPVGLDGGLPGRATDDLRLRGGMIGVHGGIRFFEEVPLRLRLGAGALLGSVRSERTGTFETRAGVGYDVPALASEPGAAYVYVAPEASVGLRFGEHVEVGAALSALVLISASDTSWGSDEVPSVVVPGDGLSTYEGGQTLAGTTVVLVPGLTARLLF